MDSLNSPAPLNIETVDGTVSNYPYELIVSNGTLTDNGDGTMTLNTAGSSDWCRTLSADGICYDLYPCVSTDRVLLGGAADDCVSILQVEGQACFDGALLYATSGGDIVLGSNPNMSTLGNSIALGSGAYIDQSGYSVALGAYSCGSSASDGATALGAYATATGDYSTALGYGACACVNHTIAIGTADERTLIAGIGDDSTSALQIGGTAKVYSYEFPVYTCASYFELYAQDCCNYICMGLGNCGDWNTMTFFNSMQNFFVNVDFWDNLNNGYVLAWDSACNRWDAQAPSSGGTTLWCVDNNCGDLYPLPACIYYDCNYYGITNPSVRLFNCSCDSPCNQSFYEMYNCNLVSMECNPAIICIGLPSNYCCLSDRMAFYNTYFDNCCCGFCTEMDVNWWQDVNGNPPSCCQVLTFYGGEALWADSQGGCGGGTYYGVDSIYIDCSNNISLVNDQSTCCLYGPCYYGTPECSNTLGWYSLPSSGCNYYCNTYYNYACGAGEIQYSDPDYSGGFCAIPNATGYLYNDGSGDFSWQPGGGGGGDVYGQDSVCVTECGSCFAVQLINDSSCIPTYNYYGTCSCYGNCGNGWFCLWCFDYGYPYNYSYGSTPYQNVGCGGYFLGGPDAWIFAFDNNSGCPYYVPAYLSCDLCLSC